MAFRRSVTLAFSTLVLVLLLTAVSALVTLRLVARSATHVTQVSNELATVLEVRLQAEQLVALSRGYLILGTAEAQQRLDHDAEQFDSALRELDGQAAESQDVTLSQLSNTAGAYVDTIRVTADNRTTARDPAAIAADFEQRLLPVRKQFADAADAFVTREKDRAAASVESARSAAQTAQIALVVLLASALALAFVLASLVGRRLLFQYRQLEQATDAARRAVAARDEILAIVSHDLRTPLTAVAMGADLLVEAGVRPELERAVRAIANAAERMRHLADDLVNRQQLEDGHIEIVKTAVECKELVAVALDLHREKARVKGIELRSEVSRAGEVKVDRERVLQVLSNIIGNALKFTPAGGSITVRAASSDGAMRFEIEDTGVGIARDQVPHLFDKFYQGEKREAGSVGLYICKRIIEAHGGSMGVESVVGRGSTFWFTCPV